jgi:hypothetical protein
VIFGFPLEPGLNYNHKQRCDTLTYIVPKLPTQFLKVVTEWFTILILCCISLACIASKMCPFSEAHLFYLSYTLNQMTLNHLDPSQASSALSKLSCSWDEAATVSGGLMRPRTQTSAKWPFSISVFHDSQLWPTSCQFFFYCTIFLMKKNFK